MSIIIVRGASRAHTSASRQHLDPPPAFLRIGSEHEERIRAAVHQRFPKKKDCLNRLLACCDLMRKGRVAKSLIFLAYRAGTVLVESRWLV